MRSKLLWVLAGVAGVGASVAFAAPRPRSEPVNQALNVLGTLTYAWHGDRARGCASRGLCGAQGSVIVHFDGYGQITSRPIRGTVSVFGASATARVRRDDPGAQPAECVDAISVAEFGITLVRLAPGRYRATLEPGQISGGRCAGPLASQIGKLRLPASRLRTHRIGFDVRGRASFAAGPFSGVLVSTLMLRPDTTDQAGSGNSGGSTAFVFPPPRPVRHVLVEYATLRYRITGAGGALGATFAGSPPPDCAPLDSCGVRGVLRLAVSGFRGVLRLSGTRTVSHRVGRLGALRDARHGRILLGADAAFMTLSGTTSEILARQQGAGAGCLDTTRVHPLLRVSFFSAMPSRPGVPFDIAGPLDGSDPLRTDCPGPSSADIVGASDPFASEFGAQKALARVSLPFGSLAARKTTVTLTERGGFRGTGYSGARSGGVSLSLTLLGSTGGTRQEVLSR